MAAKKKPLSDEPRSKKTAGEKTTAKRPAKKEKSAPRSEAPAKKRTATKSPPRKRTSGASAKAAPARSARKASTAKKAGARAVPKVSPMRGVSVDDWAKRLDGWQAEALRLIRALVARHAPGATLGIKWGQPVWEQNGPFAYARPAGKHVTFGFWRGVELSDPQGVLEGDGDKMRHVKIASADDVSKLPLDALVKQAVLLNATKGDPTKRS